MIEEIVRALIEAIKYILPSLVIFFVVRQMLKSHFENQEKNKRFDLISKNQKEMLPLRLQAYERLILFLERISLDNLIKRSIQPKMTAQSLQMSLLLTIQAEYDHNLSQQIYVSQTVWEAIKKSKEESLVMINRAMQEVKSDDSASVLNKAIIDQIVKNKVQPTQQAIAYLNQEVKLLFE